MSKEYIERDTVLMKLRMYEEWECTPNELALSTVEAIRKLIAEIPAEHSEWVKQLDGTHYCLNCGHDAPHTYIGRELCSDYCPHCGLIMRMEK